MIENNLLPTYEQLWQNTTNWTPSLEQLNLFQELYNEILAINKYLNLTRITTIEEFWEKNLWDSLAPILEYDLTHKKIIDIGTGGGFPGLPIAITFAEAKLTLMDSTNKKIKFINDFSHKLKLKNIETLVNRVEIIGQDKKYRKQYDFALIRAVAEISVCLEYSLPLLKLGGIAILYRGNLSEEEKEITEKIAHQLGGKVTKIINKNTPIKNHIRHCIYIEKTGITPKQYPREVGKPVKEPLSGFITSKSSQ
ncbi:MAG: 16S rRNA (guanine(527)-N(7))-methyltransferase RsmG [Cyanobacteria bacterium]|nr:16S rRNA (guanine(527)-N(7))-methyltransferase RsmG [Cyanobacteria bacterium CG_2015-16_32_12]NCO79290.1 16S rRNA (guanine(527)-N(7))-methyltransferase RsmG [Cyanobacteria bacterium CG_2015-22_32_23]NCQ05397.1 16S rRNA (guanine(527)-N(7))-methyltransferase RsmG [Cyanobacteria bacterium CG_2015-09_32_10]NCQ41654.1 16S rRNA (guanine(527)-N(7))-methyltransferase RsmG [Cyanobacteria bacterium CG_2015-04_32_10]NCS85603.1 16S rRNA (guanine(527)-N(7))-methyltransferase RsmG [Cyanobacteria bacterium